jgi:hypothetical protein
MVCSAQAATAQEAAPAEGGGYLIIHAEAVADDLPVLDLSGDWSRGYKDGGGGRTALISGRAEAGFWFDGLGPWRTPGEAYRLGALARVDGTARLSGDAARFLKVYQSKEDPPPGTYDASINAQTWVGTGWTLTVPVCTDTVGRWCASLTWDQMRLKRLRTIETAGIVQYLSDGTYAFRMRAYDNDSRTQEPFLAAPGSSGTGSSFSLSMRWRQAHDEQTSTWVPSEVSVRVNDAWSRLHWPGMITNTATINSDTSQRDASGYINIQPLIQGRYARETVTERIAMTSSVHARWQAPDNSQWQLTVQYRDQLWQTWLGWQGGSSWRPLIAVEPERRALKLGASWSGVDAVLWADQVDRAANLLGLQLQGRWAW